jgi:WbqC-like protein family
LLWGNQVIVAVHQPNLLPRLKVLQKLALADVWVVLDDVQFAKFEYQNRARFCPTLAGQPSRWCTVPVHLPARHATKISDVIPVDDDPIDVIERGLIASFSDLTATVRISSALRDGYNAEQPLTSLGIAGTLELLSPLSRRPKVILASELRRSADKKVEGIIQLCRAVGSRIYLSDSGGTRYIDEDRMRSAGIDTLWQAWNPPAYSLPVSDIRNGSAVNLLIRDYAVYSESLNVCTVTRSRKLAASA